MPYKFFYYMCCKLNRITYLLYFLSFAVAKSLLLSFVALIFFHLTVLLRASRVIFMVLSGHFDMMLL